MYVATVTSLCMHIGMQMLLATHQHSGFLQTGLLFEHCFYCFQSLQSMGYYLGRVTIQAWVTILLTSVSIYVNQTHSAKRLKDKFLTHTSL